MATIQSVKEKIQGLIDKANETTGGSAEDLTSAVNELNDGFGGSDFDPTDPNLKYFSYAVDLEKKEVILRGIAYGRYYKETGEYMKNVDIPNTLGGFNVVIDSDFD